MTVQGRIGVALAGLLAVAGCAAPAAQTTTAPKPVASTQVSSAQASPPSATPAPAPTQNRNTDPCATRLHDLCGPLLLYFATHQALPAKVEQLKSLPGIDVPDLVCPVSGKPYVYNRVGVPGREKGTQVILYDPADAGHGVRWGIAVKEPTPDQPLVAKVVALPDAAILRPSP